LIGVQFAAQLARVVAGTLHGGTDSAIPGVAVVDSRQVRPGDLFVALPGQRADGHTFIPQAAAAGAGAALVTHLQDHPLPQVVVDDTMMALAALGRHCRQGFEGGVVAVTGSNGKTTVKNMLLAILSRRGPTLATAGNQNNEIGLPITLSRLTAEHRYAVLEMGAGKPGDIAYLRSIGMPQVAIVLNALPAHLERLGSEAGVAQTKGELLDGMCAQDIAVINGDSPYASEWRRRAEPSRVLDFSLENPAAALRALDMHAGIVAGTDFDLMTPAGSSTVHLPLPGRHNVANALAAAAGALALGVDLADIVAGLESIRPEPGRLSVRRLSNGLVLIDDAYNANPASVKAAVDVLARCAGRRTLILGAMAELGEDSSVLHLDVGEYARQSGIDEFWGVGPELSAAVAAFGAGGRHYANRAALLGDLRGFGAGDCVLVKGSRSARMDEVVEQLGNTSVGDA